MGAALGLVGRAAAPKGARSPLNRPPPATLTMSPRWFMASSKVWTPSACSRLWALMYLRFFSQISLRTASSACTTGRDGAGRRGPARGPHNHRGDAPKDTSTSPTGTSPGWSPAPPSNPPGAGPLPRGSAIPRRCTACDRFSSIGPTGCPAPARGAAGPPPRGPAGPAARATTSWGAGTGTEPGRAGRGTGPCAHNHARLQGAGTPCPPKRWAVGARTPCPSNFKATGDPKHPTIEPGGTEPPEPPH